MHNSRKKSLAHTPLHVTAERRGRTECQSRGSRPVIGAFRAVRRTAAAAVKPVLSGPAAAAAAAAAAVTVNGGDGMEAASLCWTKYQLVHPTVTPAIADSPDNHL